MGSVGLLAGRVPAGAGDDGREARLGAERGRRVPRVARVGDEFGAAAAQPGQRGGQPQVERAADGHRRGGAPGVAADDREDRAGQPAGGLRSAVQPHRGVWAVAVSVLPAVLLADAGLRLRQRADDGHRLRHRDRDHERAVGRLQLGPRRRQYQRQQVQQHQQQPADQRQPDQLPAQRCQSRRRPVPRSIDPREVRQARGRRRPAPGLPRQGREPRRQPRARAGHAGRPWRRSGEGPRAAAEGSADARPRAVGRRSERP